MLAGETRCSQAGRASRGPGRSVRSGPDVAADVAEAGQATHDTFAPVKIGLAAPGVARGGASRADGPTSPACLGGVGVAGGRPASAACAAAGPNATAAAARRRRSDLSETALPQRVGKLRAQRRVRRVAWPQAPFVSIGTGKLHRLVSAANCDRGELDERSPAPRPAGCMGRLAGPSCAVEETRHASDSHPPTPPGTGRQESEPNGPPAGQIGRVAPALNCTATLAMCLAPVTAACGGDGAKTV